MSMSIHTFELTLYVGIGEYNRCYECISNHNTEHILPQYYRRYDDTYGYIYTTKYTFTCFRDIGINRWVFIKVKGEGDEILSCSYNLIINPKLLSGDKLHPYTSVINQDKLGSISGILETVVRQILPGHQYIFEAQKLTRIDYCNNIWMNFQKEVEDYFKLLSRFYLPSGFELFRYYDNTKHRKVSRKGEITIRCKSYEISLYLKQPQLKKLSYNHPESEIEDAEGQLRFEMRADRRWLYDTKNKEQLSDEFDLLLSSKPEVLIAKKLKSMYGSGDFYSLEIAKEKIEASPFRSKTKIKLLDVLKKVSLCRTLNYEKSESEIKDFKKLMVKFNSLDLSPITIPSRCSHDYYPNPIKYLLDESDAYLRLE